MNAHGERAAMRVGGRGEATPSHIPHATSSRAVKPALPIAVKRFVKMRAPIAATTRETARRALITAFRREYPNHDVFSDNAILSELRRFDVRTRRTTDEDGRTVYVAQYPAWTRGRT